MELKEKIKLARKNAGLTQEKLGEIVGITKQAVSLIEKGITKIPDKRTLKLIAQATNDDLGDASLSKYVNGSVTVDKKEIIRNTSIEEIINIKFGGKSSRPTKEETEAKRKLLDAEKAKMKEEQEKYGDE